MNKIKAIKKLMSGICRYGLIRTSTGMITFLKFIILKPKRGVVLTKSDSLIIHFKYPIQFMPTLMIFRELVEPEYEFLRHILTKDSVFFDVGGGIGTYSLFAAKLINGPIHTFEPIKENIQTIKNNLKANSVESKVRLNPVALSKKEGFGCMKKNASLFSSYLSEVSTKNSNNSIEVTTLDSYCLRHNIGHLDVLKIDVEGHEPDVIEGAKEIINKKKIGVIILEVHPNFESFYNFLEHMGFEFFRYDFRINSLKRIFPISEEKIRSSKLSAFHGNIVLIQPEILNKLRVKFIIED